MPCCGDSEYTIAVGYTDTTRGSGPSTVNGRMIAISGHLHDVDITNAGSVHEPLSRGGQRHRRLGRARRGPASRLLRPDPAATNSRRRGPDRRDAVPLGGLLRHAVRAGTQWRGHLDTMSQCGINTDVPAGAQAEAYPAGRRVSVDRTATRSAPAR